jgi:hypothetical protein
MLYWEKLEHDVGELRDSLGQQTPFEWFQWLATRMQAHQHAAPPIPANIVNPDSD